MLGTSDPRPIIEKLVAELTKATVRASALETNFLGTSQELDKIRDSLWAAKYASPVAAAAPKSIGLKGTANRLPHRAEAKEKPTALMAPARA